MQKRNLKLGVMCCLIILFSHTISAGVQSYSPEKRAVTDGEEVGKKVVVTCHGGYGKREILKKEGQNQWCGIALTDVCSYKKAAAAELVCSRSYQRKAAQLDPVDEKERFIKLREELIEIEQKRLELAARLLNLERREMVLKNKIASN